MLRSKRVDRSSLTPRQEASRLVAALSLLFVDWLILEQVRFADALTQAFRYADALCVRPGADGWFVHGAEAKRTRADWLRELESPEKSAPFRLYCAGWSLVVPAPWKRVVLSLEELPEHWGLIEVGTGAPHVVLPPLYREAEPLPLDLVHAMMVSADRRGSADVECEDAPPHREITRPRLSFGSVGLACGHVVPRPMDKVLPRSVACLACAAELPTDAELVEAGLLAADPSELDRYADIIGARRRARGAA